MARGGARPGAGRKKGKKLQLTLAKEAAREAVRQKVTEHLAPLIHAQIADACGLKYLVVRDTRTGTIIRVSEATARAKLRSGEEILEVWEKAPNVRAFADLLNRALDRPKEQQRDVHMSEDWDELAAMLASARTKPKEEA
jgi:hypothetical protein